MQTETNGYLNRKPTGGYRLDLSYKDLFLEEMAVNIGRGRKSVRVTVTIKEDSVKSNQQMRYYRGVVVKRCAVPFFKSLGETAVNEETAHIRLKYIVGYTEEVANLKSGEMQSLPKSLKTANKEELSEFITDVIHFLEENGLIVPRPEEYESNQMSFNQ